MATIKDVAREAGVSISTVSNTLNGSKFVSEDLRERVIETVERLGYVVNPAARGLKSHFSSVIGLIVPSVDSAFFPAVIGGLQETLKERGYVINFYSTDFNEETERDCLKRLLASRADGIILDSVSRDEGYLYSLQYLSCSGKTVPVVALERDLTRYGLSSITIDNRFGGSLAARHLVSCGARRVAHLFGRRSAPWSEERFEGFRDTLAECGVPFNEALMRNGDFTISGGWRAMQSLLESGISFDGVFAANDLSAVGALKALQRAGCSIPLVGFDDTYVSLLTEPSVTTIAVPKKELGNLAGSKIIELVENPEPAASPEAIYLEVRLVVRHTTEPNADVIGEYISETQ